MTCYESNVLEKVTGLVNRGAFWTSKSNCIFSTGCQNMQKLFNFFCFYSYSFFSYSTAIQLQVKQVAKYCSEPLWIVVPHKIKTALVGIAANGKSQNSSIIILFFLFHFDDCLIVKRLKLNLFILEFLIAITTV